ncbi:unnamed protein product [Rotaria socialis]|uniref:G-protein coupled receptors family 1 profile domain-containing protein n=1 Tax=Rotaria socialis TaxID=392032 RepID=A0A818E6Q3_9BILA|nr:unnamed protein product [Rotaria socialis]CAF4275520.1 unnamed protein product [Rotaria socialis]
MQNIKNVSTFNDYQQCNLANDILRYVGTFIFLLGSFSSILSICVFSRKSLRRKSCCFYFLILAISDSIHLLTVIIENLPYSFQIDLIVIHNSVCKIIIFLIYFSNHLSNIVLTLASIDRFILIHCPSKSKRYCNIRKGKFLVLMSTVIIFFANGHILFGYEKIYLNDKQFNDSYDCNIRTDNIFYKNLFHFYDSYIESFCLIFIPFSIMFVCSSLIIYQIVQTRKTMHYNRKGRYYYYSFHSRETRGQTSQTTSNKQRKLKLRDKDIQLCWMLIGTTFAFLLLCLPTEINDIFNYAGRERSCLDWFRKVNLMLVQQTYYAGHFYIYTLTGQLFRKKLYEILFHRNHRHHQPIAARENELSSARLRTNFNTKYQNRTSQSVLITTNITNSSTSNF